MKKKRLIFFNGLFASGFLCVTLILSGCGSSSAASISAKNTLAAPTSTIVPIPTSSNSSAMNGYLYVSPASDEVEFLQFTEQNGAISGTVTVAYITSDLGPSSVKSESSPFTGIHSGDKVSLTFSGIGPTCTGTISDTTLILATTRTDGSIVNEVFHTASIDQYNQVLAIMHQKNAVINDNDDLLRALKVLKNDSVTLSQLSYTKTLNGYANDWKSMQKDYATEQTDAAKGCGENDVNYNYVQTEDNYVYTDNNYIKTEDNYMQIEKGYYGNQLSNVETDIKDVNGSWSQLQSDAAINTTHTPAPAYTADQVNQSIADAKTAENAALDAWNSARTTAQSYDNSAAGLLKKADAVPANMHC